MSEELKACPFCGKPAQFRSMSFGDDLVRVCCSVCAISTDYYPNNDYSSAANKWQSRPIEDALQARVTELEAEQRWMSGDVSIQASRINELERQLFFLRREMEKNGLIGFIGV